MTEDGKERQFAIVLCPIVALSDNTESFSRLICGTGFSPCNYDKTARPEGRGTRKWEKGEIFLIIDV
jgi:hypothetical protein